MISSGGLLGILWHFFLLADECNDYRFRPHKVCVQLHSSDDGSSLPRLDIHETYNLVEDTKNYSKPCSIHALLYSNTVFWKGSKKCFRHHLWTAIFIRNFLKDCFLDTLWYLFSTGWFGHPKKHNRTRSTQATLLAIFVAVVALQSIARMDNVISAKKE